MEQTYSMLMDKIWKTRGEWNRVFVTEEVMREFERVLADIHECQQVLPGSMDYGSHYP